VAGLKWCLGGCEYGADRSHISTGQRNRDGVRQRQPLEIRGARSEGHG
jgi:hypothetical protein